MTVTHHVGLLVAYLGALLAWLVLRSRTGQLWRPLPDPVFVSPWREVAWALLAVAAVIGIGILYSNGWLLPATSRHRPALDAVNQLLIYCPVLLLLALRRQGLDTAWVPTQRVLSRVGVGVVLAVLGLLLYALVRTGLEAWPELVAHTYQPGHVSYLVQVLLEDVSIAVLFVRFRAALGLRATLLVVATLFAAGHIPGLLEQGAAPRDLAALLGDAGLGVLALAVLHRSRDVWWFWMVHFALDMTQFFQASAAA
ncbi:MAG TPA: hypothetical protein VIQ76_01595 [Propionibacteriaceae bacterium]|jgi:hypothetical protein